MRWVIQGADAHTGQYLRIELEAESLVEAQARARANGMERAQIAPAAPTTVVPVLDYGRETDSPDAIPLTPQEIRTEEWRNRQFALGAMYLLVVGAILIVALAGAGENATVTWLMVISALLVAILAALIQLLWAVRKLRKS